ncbi:MAG: methyltransferase [Acidobacteria bacterium]|nr:methyltransferase [Acidobacteriota bacterium]
MGATSGDVNAWWVDRYRRDPATGVLFPHASGPTFTYSDGDEVEERLARIVATTSDLSVMSVELSGRITDWPSLYHLSPRRANLLRPIESLIRGKVLEVGAGCGVITRFLGELGAEVVALEPSRRRAAIAASRCRDLPNVHVVCDRLESVDLGTGFDAVTLIGVLEYARLYSGGANPVQGMLERARSLLGPGGHLIVAIENQLGLKYFGGYAEDHLDALMYGINDLYEDSSVVTFGRSELENHLVSAGFATVDVHVPLPDYKLPTTIVMKAGTGEPVLTECLASLAASSPIADGQRPVFPLFSIERAWRVVCRNGLLAELANSFLMVASPVRRHNAAADEETLLAVHCGGWRRPEFSKITEIRRRADGIHVTRRLLRPELGGHVPGVPLAVRLVEEPFRRGGLWSEGLTNIVNRQGWTVEPVVAWARVWLDCLAQEAGMPTADPDARVPGRCLDATPFNLIRGPEGEFHFVDLEWDLEDPLDLGWVLFRSLYGSFAGLSSVAEPDPSVSRRIVDLVAKVADGLDLPLDAAAVARYCEAEVRLQRWVAASKDRPRLEDFTSSELAVRPGLASVQAMRASHGRLEQEIGRLHAELATRDGELTRLATVAERVVVLEGELCAAADRLSESRGEVERLAAECEVRDVAIVDLAEQLRVTRTQSVLRLGAAARDMELLAARVVDRERAADLGQHRQGRAQEGLVGLSARLSRGTHPRLAGVARSLAHLAQRSRREEVCRVIASGLFDEAFYRRHNLPDARPRISPLMHFMTRGAAEHAAPSALFDVDWFARGCDPPLAPGESPILRFLDQPPGGQADPHPLFSVRWYLGQVGGSTAAASNPLSHFLAGGAFSPHPLFDPSYYLRHNPDVEAAGWNPLVHYLEYGASEGRAPHPLFDSSFYLELNPDVADECLNPLVHFVLHGGIEGRAPHPLFDTSFYLETNPDVAASGLNPLVHFVLYGGFEGRAPHPRFDAAFYLLTNPDVAESGLNPLVHYVRFGASEGRRPHPDFDSVP